MKKYILFLALVPLFMACENGKSGIETTQSREQFVGVYSLVSSGYYNMIYDGEEMGEMYRSDSTYFELRLDTSSQTKLLAFDYIAPLKQLNDTLTPLHQVCILDGLSAYVNNGYLYFDTYHYYDYYNLSFMISECNETIIFDKALLNMNRLLWYGSFSLSSLENNHTRYISGKIEYVATKIKQKAE